MECQSQPKDTRYRTPQNTRQLRPRSHQPRPRKQARRPRRRLAQPPIQDATYEKIRVDGQVVSCAFLVAIDIRKSDGKRIILGCSVSLSEAEIHWRAFFQSLKARGLGLPRIVTSDARLGEAVETYSKTAPELSAWMEENVAESLAVFALPEPVRKRLRTSNACENLNKQIGRGTKVCSIFPNEGSLLRLASAILMEQSEE